MRRYTLPIMRPNGLASTSSASAENAFNQRLARIVVACFRFERKGAADIDQQRPARAPGFVHRDGKVFFRVRERLCRAVVDSDNQHAVIAELDLSRFGVRHIEELRPQTSYCHIKAS